MKALEPKDIIRNGKYYYQIDRLINCYSQNGINKLTIETTEVPSVNSIGDYEKQLLILKKMLILNNVLIEDEIEDLIDSDLVMDKLTE